MKHEVNSLAGDDGTIVSLYKIRWRLFSVIALGIGFSILVLMFSESKYQAEVKTLPAELEMTGSGDGGSLGALAGLAGINLTARSSIKYEALEILQSTTFINSFIESDSLLDDLFADKWNSEAGKWNRSIWGQEPTIADGSKLFRGKMLRVREDRRTGIITVSIQWRDREQAAAWANSLVARLNAEMRNRAIDDADASLKYLYDQIEKTQNMEVRQAIYRLVENEIKRAMLAQVREEYALRIIDRAHVPDESDKIWPKAGLILVGGASFGVLMALLLIVVSRFRLLLRDTRYRSDNSSESDELGAERD